MKICWKERTCLTLLMNYITFRLIIERDLILATPNSAKN